MYSAWSDWALPQPGFPIRTPSDRSLLAAPRGVSSPATSFIGSWRQGIHPVPCVARPRSATHPLASAKRESGSSPCRYLRQKSKFKKDLISDHVFTWKGSWPEGPASRQSRFASSGPLVGGLENARAHGSGDGTWGRHTSTARGTSSRRQTAVEPARVFGVYPIFSSLLRGRCS